MNNSEVYNDVKIIGQALKTGEIWGRASNFDNRSDTDINLIGRRILMDERSDYWNAEQCVELAKWQLKRKTVLQKSVTIQCGQLFHLNENRLISVKRTDKDGSPIEKHLIQSYSLPIGETGAMSINAVSVNDIDIDMTVTSSSDRGEWEEPEVEGDTMFLKQTYGATQSGSTLTLE